MTYPLTTTMLSVPGAKAVGFGNDVLLPGYWYPSQTLAGPGGQAVKASMQSFGIGFPEMAGLRLRRGLCLRFRAGA